MKINEILQLKLTGKEWLYNISKISDTLMENGHLVVIAEWLHYDLIRPKHIMPFLKMCEKVKEYGYHDVNIELEGSHSIGDFVYGNQDKNILEFYNKDYNSQLVDDFFAYNRDDIIKEFEKVYGYTGGLTDLVVLATKKYLEFYLISALNLEVNTKKE